MFCMQCGAKLPDNAKFCFQCGAKVLLDTSAHESTVLVEPKPVQEANQNDQDSEVKKMPMVPKKELIQPEEKVVLKLGNRNLEFSEEIKDKIAMTSYYNEIGKSNGEKFRKFYQNAQIAVMEDVMKKVYPFYDNLMEQANKIAFQRLLSRKIYDIREADYYGKVQNTSLKGKEPLKFYSEYRRDYLLGGRTGKEKLANPVNTMMCFVEALKDHAYILKMIEARILVEHGLLKEYNFDTAKLDTRRENIKNVLGSVCNREHTDQEIQKAYEDVLNVDIDGLQANPFKALYYAEIYSVGKILKSYGNIDAQLLLDLFKIIDFFEVRESCKEAINQIARSQLKKKLEELHQSPDKAPMLYHQMLQIVNEVKEDNPLFALSDFKDELNQCALAWLNLKLDEVHKSPDQILTLYPELIQTLNKIKVDMPFFNAGDFMGYAECCKEQVLEHTEFCDEYSFYTDQVMQGKLTEVLKAADLNNAAAQYVLEKYYREVIFQDEIKCCSEKFLHGVMFYLTEERTNESDFRQYLEALFRFEMFAESKVGILDKELDEEIRDKADNAMIAIRNLANKRKPCIAAVRRIGTYYLSCNEVNSAMPYLKLAAEQHDPVAMAICGEALYLEAKDDRTASEKGYCYLRSATFAGEPKALKLNKKYDLGYPVNIMLDSSSGKYKQVTTEKCFTLNGETIQMTAFPRVIINKYRGNLRGIDLLLNEGNELLQSTQLSNVRKSCKIPAQEKVYMAYSMDSFSHFKDGMTGFAIGATGFYAKSGSFTAGCIPWKKFVKLKIYQEDGIEENGTENGFKAWMGGLHIGEYVFFSKDQEVTLMELMEDLKKLCEDSLLQENENNKVLLNSPVAADIISPENEEAFKRAYERYRIYAMQGELGYLWEAANTNDPIAQYALTQYYRYDILGKTIEKDDGRIFDRILLEVKKLGKETDYAIYLNDYLEYERKEAFGRTPTYGIDKALWNIIELAEKENACISAVATAGKYLTMRLGDEEVRKGFQYLEYAAEQCAPEAMASYGEYLLKGHKNWVEKNPKRAECYLKLAAYAQQKEALFLNERYNLGYVPIDLGGAHILNKETTFVDDGEIRMISFPWSLFVHYSTKLTTWPKDVLMNGGKELVPSQELNFARESFEIPSSEKIYFVLAANLLGHFKKNMRGLAIGTEGIYLREVLKAGFISWDEFCDEDIYIQDGVHIGNYTVICAAMEDILCEFLLDLQELSRIPVGEGSELAEQIRQEENVQKRKVGQETENTTHKVIEQNVAQGAEQIANEKFLEEKFCPICKKANKKNAKFCSGCGFTFNEERSCPKCGNKIKPGKKFCSACGAKVED